MSDAGTVWIPSLLAVAIASGIPLAGVWMLASRPSLSGALVPRLILMAAGALLGAALFHLIPESAREQSGARVAVLVVLGVAAFAALERWIHSLERPADGPPHAPLGHHNHLMPLGIASDALHNAIDGALIATAFLANPSVGVFAGAAIALHELPRELGTYALCVAGGMSPRRAILVNAATGVLALLGAVAALSIGAAAGRVGGLLVPFAAGNFLYLAGAILLAQRGRPSPDSSPRRWALVLAGVAMTALLAGGR